MLSIMLFLVGILAWAVAIGYNVMPMFMGKNPWVEDKGKLLNSILPIPLAIASFLGSIAAKLQGW